MSLDQQIKALNTISNGNQDNAKIGAYYDEPLERKILSGLLRNDYKYYHLAELINAEDFYIYQHKKIFKVCKYLSENEKDVNPINIDQSLKQYNDTSGITLTFLETLYKECEGFKNDYHDLCAHLKRHSTKRMLYDSAKSFIEGIDKGADIETLVGEHQKKISSAGREEKFLYNFFDSYEDIVKEFEHRYNNRDQLYFKTGIKTVDDVVKLSRGNLVVVGAKTGSGKTTFCMNIARNMALDGRSVLFISTEMNKTEVNDKFLAIGSGVPLELIMSGKINLNDDGLFVEQKQKIGKAIMEHELSKLYIDTKYGQTLASIREECKRLKETVGLDVLIVDYIQRIKLPGKKGRYDEVTDLSNELKDLAQELDICIFEISQFSRDGMKNSTKNQRPTLNSFKESGSIENDANVAMLLYRESTDDKIKDKDRKQGKYDTELIIAKNRMGETGDYMLYMYLPNNRMWGRYDHFEWTEEHINQKEVTI